MCIFYSEFLKYFFFGIFFNFVYFILLLSSAAVALATLSRYFNTIFTNFYFIFIFILFQFYFTYIFFVLQEFTGAKVAATRRHFYQYCRLTLALFVVLSTPISPFSLCLSPSSAFYRRARFALFCRHSTSPDFIIMKFMHT